MAMPRKATMLIAQISDLHISRPGQNTCGVAPMADNLAACIDSLNGLAVRPDVVLISGDVTQSGTPQEVAHAAHLLATLDSPYYMVPGNHDNRQALWDAFGGTACPTRENGFLNFALTDHPVQIIGLDSTTPGKPGGAICPNRAAWLRARLIEADGAPVVIVLHHPPLRLGVPETDVDGFANAADLGAIVEEFPNIERLLCGHIHLETHSRWHGSVVTTAPSMGMQLTLGLGSDGPSQFFLSPPAYLLHHWTADGILVTHNIGVAPLDGPHGF
ncbi:MAG TPA: phosphodiesterase [Rhodobacterales bacterium]|nr:phosphodiesterase [Rhodobacterales bacterium]